MEKSVTKISLALFIIGAIVWLGAVPVRAAIGNELLEFGTINFKQNLSPEIERELYRLLSYTTLLTMSGYVVALASAVIFVKTTTLSYKQHGWLLMCAILFFMFVPVELFTLTLDWKIIGLNFWGSWELVEFRKAFIARFTALAGVPLIALLSYFTIIVVAAWQPLKKK